MTVGIATLALEPAFATMATHDPSDSKAVRPIPAQQMVSEDLLETRPFAADDGYMSASLSLDVLELPGDVLAILGSQDDSQALQPHGGCYSNSASRGCRHPSGTEATTMIRSCDCDPNQIELAELRAQSIICSLKVSIFGAV
jgi:hypothetical protein